MKKRAISDLNLMILSFFREPERAKSWSYMHWERLFQLARDARLMGTLAYFIQENELWESVPERGRWLLESAIVKAERGKRQTLWEVECIRKAVFRNAYTLAVAENDIPVILLKGAAYQAAEMPWGKGRLSVDVDIMTPLATLSTVEAALTISGWIPEKKSEYDEHFYRDWMHEIPPMVHLDRGTTLDVHHTILPRTGRLTVNADLLFHEIVPLRDNLYVLGPCDMLLHSAVHMFQDGELDNCARDLLDLATMFQFLTEKDVDFWEKLLARSQELGVTRPLYHAVTFCEKLLGMEFPSTFLREVRRFRGGIVSRSLMAWAVSRTIEPEIAGEEKFSVSIARLGLYIRSHFLRMPLRILIPHLWAKYRQRRRERKEKEQEKESIH
ncbi:MAG: nucleotidyltransferase family protein [Planctomycetia bacterium]|nr:nucleotidyltransferase family protein [Planctomycetia bacterium]